MPGREPAHRLAFARRHRRDHEAETAATKGVRGVETTCQALERGLPRVPEPPLLVEVVNGHESARSFGVDHDPVVAPGSDRCVLAGHGGEAPAVGKRLEKCTRLDVLRQRPHDAESNAGLRGAAGAFLR